jgi:AmmeMemoRadiSam system protein B
MEIAGERIRSPVASGLLYPDNPDDIMAAFAAYGLRYTRFHSTDAAPESRAVSGQGTALAVIAPHGAWNLSGEAAAEAFRSCRGRNAVSRVVILGMIHGPKRGGLFLSSSDSFETPLGNIPVDGDACEELASCSTIFEINDTPHLRECSIEVLLPFIKYCFPKASIVPVLMGLYSSRLIKALAAALNIVFGPERGKTLFVISSCLAKSDLSDRAFLEADHFTRLLLAGDGPAIGSGCLDGSISGCGSPLAAAFLESGLSDNKKNRLLPGIRQIPGESGFVCYGSFALE